MEFKGKEVLISQKEIKEKIKEIAVKISKDYFGKEPLLICVLKGAFIFMSDLIRELEIPIQIDFMAVSSYGASTKTSGVVRILKDLDTSIEGRHVIIVEDIIDTGLTLKYLKENLISRDPASLKVVTLLDKPERREVSLEADYFGFKIPNKFIVGYGLDFDEQYRQLPDIWVLQ